MKKEEYEKHTRDELYFMSGRAIGKESTRILRYLLETAEEEGEIMMLKLMLSLR